MYTAPGKGRFGGGGGGGGNTKKVKAMYDFRGENPGDLTFRKGDIIQVISESAESGPEWWKGEVGGKRGSFPVNHVEVLQENIRSYERNDVNIPMATYNRETGGYVPGPSSVSSYSPPAPSNSKNDDSKSSYDQSEKQKKPKEKKPPKEKKAKTSTSFSGGAAEKFARVGLVISLVVFFFAFIATCFPWYYDTPGGKGHIFQWTGMAEYPVADGAATKTLTSSKVFLRTYKGLNYPTLKALMIVSLTFLVLGLMGIFIQSVMFFLIWRGKEVPNRVILVISLLVFAFLLIATMQFLRFGSTFRKDVQNGGGNIAGPVASFTGSEATGRSWGPGLGWCFGIVSLGGSLATAIVGLLIIKENGGGFLAG
eukprot:TRINITY_DN2795_c0_g1_i1.p1 TRINITY_DN2795_c0_g1~~TRINITY_DN2795_c0_g1_i1.p1  ORF type:complete len:380 (-),score=74.39 TRINITY_DN2795_c0_g1_i1:499-1599(-)